MRRIDSGTVSAWSVAPDEAKLAYLEGCFQRHYGPVLPPELRDFHAFLNAQPSYRHSAHYYRYLTTFAAAVPHLGGRTGLTILETGGSSPLLDYLSATHACHVTTTDLRDALDCPDGAADIVLSLEVLEHLKDRRETTMDEIVLFRETGVACYAREIARCLRPGGLLIMTTPNAASAQVFQNVVEGNPGMVFRPHVREYTRDEVLRLFAGLELVEHRTFFNFFHMGDNGAAIIARIVAAGGSPEHRGDDHFFVFRRPA
ncbi:MAG TPA: methyltransferase domain-containing protein [Paracoccaceae bacterium]|jgi:SAM-dependent methyltransferase|nr:methyltransferase domain-containing protein [Paracoccaceae bacterium]